MTIARSISVLEKRWVAALGRILERRWVQALLFAAAFLCAWLARIPVAHSGA